MDISYITPENWIIRENSNSADNYKDIEISSPDVRIDKSSAGNDVVVNGAIIRISIYELNGKSIDEFYNKGLTAELIKNGSVKPSKITLGEKTGIEYKINYEAPEHTVTDLAFGTDRVVEAIYNSKENSHDETNFAEYHKILTSITRP